MPFLLFVNLATAAGQTGPSPDSVVLMHIPSGVDFASTLQDWDGFGFNYEQERLGCVGALCRRHFTDSPVHLSVRDVFSEGDLGP